MTEEKKMELLEELLEMEQGGLRPEMSLADLENWDSMTALSLIVMIDEECGKRISGDEVKGLRTVSDILAVME